MPAISANPVSCLKCGGCWRHHIHSLAAAAYSVCDSLIKPPLRSVPRSHARGYDGVKSRLGPGSGVNPSACRSMIPRTVGVFHSHAGRACDEDSGEKLENEDPPYPVMYRFPVPHGNITPVGGNLVTEFAECSTGP
jgi:hypothetical protein